MQVIITPKAQKQYRKLTKIEQIKIRKKLLLLEKLLIRGKKLSGGLAQMHSLRVWPYRIIYWINKKLKKIYIVTIAHRQGVYDK